MYFVAKIHNNSLGRTIQVSSEDEGITFIREMAEEQLNRPLFDDEMKLLETDLELNIDMDYDNQYTWAIGIMET